MKSAVSETELNAYLDGQLPPGQAARLEVLLAEDPDGSSRLKAMAEHKQLLRFVLTALPNGEDEPRQQPLHTILQTHGAAPTAAATQSLTTRVRQLLAALDRLPDRQCEALVLLAFWNMKYGDAARVLDIPPEAFLSHVVCGRKALLRTLGSKDRVNSVKFQIVEGDQP
ncbi:hypothetical protein SAE02_70450 [Skermanella aerolata]|uniref:RNA polymerase sigma factor 70 region 4 type 2 domain-containing protein n=1 Tax=Skermanella aerolata TaxID=393310 RepID=A0A512E2H0_9PROT|nr:hypothetical protein [Skermanella aerolata]KJB91390.1 hypothetical protein N826_30565 [Skermanella aerolata KACC 11604]GEO42897.1 hypothetical protein SAE02_70450 [Skermanella aerolata]